MFDKVAKAELTRAYLAAYHGVAKKVLPPVLHAHLHKLALPIVGGKSTVSDVKKLKPDGREPWFGDAPVTAGAALTNIAGMVSTAKAEGNKLGAMVALYPPTDDAGSMSWAGKQDGAEPTSELHLTLAFLGNAADLSDDDQTRLKASLEWFAGQQAPVDGVVTGVARFTAGDETHAVVALVDSPQLPDFRQDLCEELDMIGVEPNATHGFIPHITLAYVGSQDPAPLLAGVPNRQLHFGAISLVIGGVRTDFPLTGVEDDLWDEHDNDDEDDGVGVYELSKEEAIAKAGSGWAAWDAKHGNDRIKGKGASKQGYHNHTHQHRLGVVHSHPHSTGHHRSTHTAAQAPTVVKSEDHSTVTIEVPILVPLQKAEEEEQRIVYGMVLVPGHQDSQGDVIDAQTIEKAAHDFMEKYRALGTDHIGDPRDGLSVVESYCAPTDLEIADMRGRMVPVPRGTWLMATRINNDEIWASVKSGARLSYSIHGSGLREEIAA